MRLEALSRGDDARAWESFASLAQRQRKSRNREAQLLQLQTSVVAIWGKDVFTHYGWRELPLDSAKLLHSVASKLPKWDLAVEEIHHALIARHESRVIKKDNRARRIGEHARGSKIQHRYSPVEPRDLEIILTRVEDGKLHLQPQANRKKHTDTIDGTPIRSHGLKRDRFSMIIPDDIKGPATDSTSPSQRASKRRRLSGKKCKSPDQSGDLPSSPPESRPESPSASTMDSELTEYEETTSDGNDADIGSIPQTPTGNDNSADEAGDDGQSTPPVLDTETQTSREPSFGPNSTSSQDSAKSSDEGHSPHSPDAILDTESFDLSNGALQEPQKPSVVLERGGNLLSSKLVEKSFEIVSPSEDCNLVPVPGQNMSSIQSPGTDIPSRQEDESNKESQTGAESGAEFTNADDIAALETVASMDNQSKSVRTDLRSENIRGIPCELFQHDKHEGMTLCSEGFPAATTCGKWIPASTEQAQRKSCINTDIEDLNAIVGRMASRHAERLRAILDNARKHSDDQSIRDQNQIKVEWLEDTQWANVYAVPSENASVRHLPLDADVWYMDWQTFQQRAKDGEVFRKPIVVRQDFQDSGMYEPHYYMSLLRERYPHQKLDVQSSDTGQCLTKSIMDLWATKAEAEEALLEESIAGSNFINLRKIANADAPLLTRLKRFRLLETVIERASNLAPGKRTTREAHDVSDCLGFDLLGFNGAFSRPHVDALVGT